MDQENQYTKIIQFIKDNFIKINTLNFLHDNTEKIKSASVSGDYPLIALYSIEIYRALAEELDDSKLNLPKEIVLLDYVGFKILVLLKQNNISWNKINDVAVEGKILWNKIKNKIYLTLKNLQIFQETLKTNLKLFILQVQMEREQLHTK